MHPDDARRAHPANSNQPDPVADSPETQAGTTGGVSSDSTPHAHHGATQLEHFRLQERIGRGGIGDVYKAYDESLQRTVAIKLLPSALARSDELTRRFRAEALAAARLTHPNVVPIYWIGQEGEQPFFAMRFVDGESLSQLLLRESRLPVQQAVAILEQVLSALEAAHDQGLVHRDIRPGNVLLDSKTGRALLADFGMVKSLADVTGQTAAGLETGAADYLSPEQGQGKQVDGRSDLYSLGVMAYEMLGGCLPFTADSATSMIFKHVNEEPPALAELVPEIPDALVGFVSKLMSKSPQSRYQSARDALVDVRQVVAKEDPPGSSLAGGKSPTRIIASPRFGDAPRLPADLGTQVPLIWWQRARQRLVQLRQRHTPEVFRRLENTQLQVDGAVAEYERRYEQLDTLVQDAKQSLGELHRQAESHRSASGDVTGAEQEDTNERWAAELEEQISLQTDQLESMQLQLSQTHATLVRLRAQRDMLMARLKTAQAEQAFSESPTPVSHWSTVAPLAILLLALSGWGWLLVTPIRSSAGLPASAVAGDSGRTPADSAQGVEVQPDDLLLHSLSVPGRWVDFSSDSLTLAVACEDKSVMLWGSQSGQLQKTLSGHQDRVYCVDFSRSDEFLASSCRDGTVIVWNMSSGERHLTLHAHRHVVRTVAFAPNGKLLATGSDDKTISLWDLENRRQLGLLLGHTYFIRDLEFSPDGTELASASNDRTIRIWDAKTGAEKYVLTGHTGFVFSISYSPNQPKLVSTGKDGTVRFWDLSKQQPLATLSPDAGDAHTAVFSPDGLTVASSHQDKSIRIWDVETYRELRVLRSPQEIVWALAYSPDGKLLASTGVGTVNIWSMD